MRRWIFAAALFLWLTPVLAVAAGGLRLRVSLSVLVGSVAAAAVAGLASRQLDLRLGAQVTRSALLAAALVAAAAVAIIRFGTFSVFMADVHRPEFSVDATDPFRVRHSCLSAYAESARLANEGGHNIYERELYQPSGVPRQIGPLRVDPFHYPPPFLLVPQVLRAVAPDFWDLRRIWFALQALTLAGALVGLAAWVGGRSGAVLLLGGLIVLGLPHVVFTFQQGNFQITAVPLAVVACVLIMGRRVALGSGLLAYAALAKIFPGVLVVPLLAAREWRRLAWVGAFGIALLSLTLVVQGTAPLRDFVSTSVPEISSGAAFPQTESLQHSRVNWSFYGQTVRLRQLGIDWLTQRRGLMLTQVYGLAVLALAAWAGFRRRYDLADAEDRLSLLLLAVGLVGLASFRSPFVGAVYGCVSTLWLMGIFAARTASMRAAAGWLAGLCLLATAIWLMPTPARPAMTSWIWGSGGLAGICMVLSATAVIQAGRSARRDARLAAPAQPALHTA